MNFMQRLDEYRVPSSWDPGHPVLCSIWFLLGSPLLSNRFLPGSYWRILLLRFFGSKISPKCRIKPGLRIKYPWRLRVGYACWLGENVWIDNVADVQLGDRVCISQGAYLCTGNHDFCSPGFDLLLGPIIIESDVWIAAGSILSPGTKVCSGAVVALGSVVSGKVPPAAIVRGNPAVLVGHRSIR